MKADHADAGLEARREGLWKQHGGVQPAQAITPTTGSRLRFWSLKCVFLLKHLFCFIGYLCRKLRKCRIIKFLKVKQL